MKVTREQTLHIAKLANLELKEDEIESYALHLQEILNYANIVNEAPIEGLDIAIHAQEKKNRFRKDEIKEFEDIDLLLENAPSKRDNMFQIPKVID